MSIRTRFALRLAACASAATMLTACAVTGSGKTNTAGDQNIEIAFLAASSANTWLTASSKAMNEDAAKDGVKITTFDAKFQPGVAAKQIQDVIASGKYKGIIIASIDGAGVIPAVQQALDAGLKVVVLNQIIGDRLDTADPQVPGISASVLAPPTASGERVGRLAAKACAGVDPCNIVYLYGTKGIPVDVAVRQGFDGVMAKNPNMKIVAEGEGGYLGTDEPRKATQDIIQAHPDFTVLVGAGDQQVRGALLALQDAGKTNVKTIGFGGSEPAISGIKAGTWWGDVMGAPATEGHRAYQAMMEAVKNHKDLGGIDVTSELVDDGLITPENVSKFTAQWAG